MKLAHVGLAVERLDDAIALWTECGFTLEKTFDKTEPRAKVAIVKDESEGRLELWEFEDANYQQARIIGRHIAFLCQDVISDAEKLKSAGFSEVIPFTEGVTLDYMFLQDPNGTYYELAQPK